MDNLNLTISNLHNEQMVKSERAAVLLCVPLTRKRFEKKTREPGLLKTIVAGKRNMETDQLRFLPGWEQYEAETVLPVLNELLKIRENTSASVIPDVTVRDFKKAVTSGAFDVIILVARHLCKKIEFADRHHSPEEIYRFLSRLDSGQKISMIYMICESEEIEEATYNKITVVKSVASAFWEIPLVEGIAFVRHWFGWFNGKNTLSIAYDLALESYLEENAP